MSDNSFKYRYAKGLSEFAYKSYTEEKERKDLLIRQSGSLLIAISVMTAFVGSILPLALQVLENIVETSTVLLFFLIIIIPLFIDFILSILILWRNKYNSLPFGSKYKEHINDNLENYQEDDSQFYYDLFSNITEAHESIAKANDTKANIAKAAHICLFVSIFAFLTSIFAIIIILI